MGVNICKTCKLENFQTESNIIIVYNYLN
jgi:hypothetical protein